MDNEVENPDNAIKGDESKISSIADIPSEKDEKFSISTEDSEPELGSKQVDEKDRAKALAVWSALNQRWAELTKRELKYGSRLSTKEVTNLRKYLLVKKHPDGDYYWRWNPIYQKPETHEPDWPPPEKGESDQKEESKTYQPSLTNFYNRPNNSSEVKS